MDSVRGYKRLPEVCHQADGAGREHSQGLTIPGHPQQLDPTALRVLAKSSCQRVKLQCPVMAQSALADPSLGKWGPSQKDLAHPLSSAKPRSPNFISLLFLPGRLHWPPSLRSLPGPRAKSWATQQWVNGVGQHEGK